MGIHTNRHASVMSERALQPHGVTGHRPHGPVTRAMTSRAMASPGHIGMTREWGQDKIGLAEAGGAGGTHGSNL